MKPRHMYTALLLVLSGGCATPHGTSEAWLGRDKAQHVVAAGALSAACTAVAAHHGASDGAAMAWAVPITLCVGAGKEVYDRNVKHTKWSWRDMTWNLVGAAAGGLLVLQVR